MSFRVDVVNVLGDGVFTRGLSGKGVRCRAHIRTRPRELAGSADVDTALAATFPNAHRWDYVVGKMSEIGACPLDRGAPGQFHKEYCRGRKESWFGFPGGCAGSSLGSIQRILCGLFLGKHFQHALTSH